MERGGTQTSEQVKTPSLQVPAGGELRAPDELPPPSAVANDDTVLSANPLSGACAEPYPLYRLNLETGAVEQVPGE